MKLTRFQKGRRLPCIVALALLGVGMFACGTRPAADTWLRGDTEERFAIVAKQLRGFDVAMLEVGHRHEELYRAGRGERWEYAAYQLDEMRKAIEYALERRPARAASARLFLDGPLKAMDDTVERRDPDLFRERFEALTVGCNTCHQLEEVEFIRIEAPEPPPR